MIIKAKDFKGENTAEITRVLMEYYSDCFLDEEEIKNASSDIANGADIYTRF